MRTNPIYIKKLSLSDIRTFKKVTINFENEKGILPQWTIIIGDNNLGKTTIMQSIVWMKPLVPNSKDTVGEEVDYEKIEPVINTESNQSLERIVNKNGARSGKISAVFVADRILNSTATDNEIFCNSEYEIILNEELKLKDYEKKFETNSEDIFLDKEVIIFPYSASRRLTQGNLYEPDQEDIVILFNSEDSILYDVEQILHTIKYASLDSSGKESAKYSDYLGKIKAMLISILPKEDGINDIVIAAPKLVDGVMERGEVLLSTKHGYDVPFTNVSLGYRSIMSLTLDIAWRLFNKYPESLNPLHESAIVLIDELDQHLHPTWQREIINQLSDNFPKIQFIATAHSPLIVQAATNANYEIVKETQEGSKVISDTENIDGWRIDQILTSDFFDLSTARGPEIEKKIQERRTLLKMDKLDIDDENRLKELTFEIEDLPVGDNVNEIKAAQALRDFAKKLEEVKAGGK